MRCVLRATLVSILGFSLGFSSQVQAEIGGKADATTPKATVPVAQKKATTATPANSEGTSTPRTGGAKGATHSADAGALKDAKEKDSHADGGGYTWSAKKPVVAGKKAPSTRRIDPQRPFAQAPNFEMRADGSSVVTLSVSRAVEVKQQAFGAGKTKGRVVVFQLKLVQVGVHNNTNPLITEHFQTPLRRVVLRREGKGATLRLEFREDVSVTQTLKAGPSGSSLVEIVIPKPTRAYPPPATRKTERSDTRVNTNDEVKASKGDDLQGGAPGPEL